MLCQCSDHGCPVHIHRDCDKTAKVTVRRIDMEDHTGTPMCEPCAVDALESGLFVDLNDLFNGWLNVEA